MKNQPDFNQVAKPGDPNNLNTPSEPLINIGLIPVCNMHVTEDG